MYTALYRAQRPETFEEILGQEHIVKILKYQLRENATSHAYLFCGTRGTGKTTTARILAKGLNCLEPKEDGGPCGICQHCQSISQGNFMDVIEIDAASNNGVDNIRELRESVKYPPAVGKKKVYIIDEVHMLSTAAFNALLKTLEEPPEYILFILATTEPQKLPATILSRCMRLDFKRVRHPLLMEGMQKICLKKGVEISEDALKLLANCADGSVRDGLSILDQVLACGEKKIQREDVIEYLGGVGEDFFIELTEAVSLHKISDALLLLDHALAEGKDVKQIMKDWVSHYRNLLITKFIRDPQDMMNMTVENIQRVQEQSHHISLEEIDAAILRLSKAIHDARWSPQPRILLELAIVAIASDLIDDEKVERQLSNRRISPTVGNYITGVAKEEGRAETVIAKPGESMIAHHQEPQIRTYEEVKPNRELEELWHQVFEQGEDEIGSFNLIRNGTCLITVTENDFTVSAKTPFVKRYVQEHQRRLETMMQQRLGRHVHMHVIDAQADMHGVANSTTIGSIPKENDAIENFERLVEEAGQALGINIEIQE